MTEEKVCTRCNQLKPLSEFWPATKWPDGTTRTLRSHCRTCGSELNAIYMQERKCRNLALAGNLAPVDAEREPRLPIGPFREWLHNEIEARQSAVVVSELTGVDGRTMNRWLRESNSVGLDLVDRMLCGCDQPEVLRDLYPELYAEEVAA